MRRGATIAIGVAIVSFVMAAILVPSLSALIGTKVWWPGHQEAAAAERPHPEPRPTGELAPASKR
jgi:RND superfamily putative drug exporter